MQLNNFLREMALNKKRFVCMIGILLSLVASQARAGVDIAGPVEQVHLAADGKLWFVMQTTPASTYCKPGWASLNMYVPKEHAEYPYYYAMLMTAVSKGKSVYVANISVYNGTEPCDITKTGFGLMLLQ